ncbi:serine/threonine-protein kinase haspin [Pancytospora philotis]|nr:serine/threonine-protein kinase haspin [Pancytospora philotis]
MALHRYGKHHGDGSSMANERVHARFENLKTRMRRESFCGSILIEDSGAFSEVLGRGPNNKMLVLRRCSTEENEATKNQPKTDIDNSSVKEQLENLELSFNDSLCAPAFDFTACAAVAESPQRKRARMPDEICDFSTVVAPSRFYGAERDEYSIILPDIFGTTEGERPSCEAPVDSMAAAQRITTSKHEKTPDAMAAGNAGQSLASELRALEDEYLRQRSEIIARHNRLQCVVAGTEKLKLPRTKAVQLQEQPVAGKPCVGHPEPSDAPVHGLRPTTEMLKRALALETIPFAQLPQGVVKIAEASFSEVFRVGNDIYKIIAFNEWFNADKFYTEVGILAALRGEEGIVQLRRACILEGAYTPAYLAAWSAFPDSENPHPSAYGAAQRYGCIVMEDAGRDLESYAFSSSKEILAFAFKLVRVLFRLQDRFCFEHRDLHWGNVLIRGAEISLIDFSFSRLDFALQSIGQSGDSAVSGPALVYTDLEDEGWLFDGDGQVDEQFEVYREMRRCSGGDWAAYCPASNGLWMRYIIRKLLAKSAAIENQRGQKRANRILSDALQQLETTGWNRTFLAWCAEREANEGARAYAVRNRVL